ncbi:MAG: right-handed parallel beta-helix repeat-containing protein [Clostridiales bacterium]
MKKFMPLFTVIFIFALYNDAFSALSIEDSVSGIWKRSSSPIFIKENTQIAKGDTLVIEPGVKILFSPGKNLFVNGTLKAIGTQTDSIYFTSEQKDQKWGIILFQNMEGSLSEMQFCRIENASYLESYEEWGAVSVSALNVNISNCTIQNNYYAGIWIDYIRTYPSRISLNFEGNLISNNLRYGIFSNIASDLAFQCLNNRILRNGSDGINFNSGGCVLKNNVVAENSGHGIFCNHSNVLLDFNTITNNHNSGIHCEWGSTPVITNSIIYGNSQQQVDLINTSISISYSDVEGYWEGEGNIALDPKFTDPLKSDYHLSAISPCIDGASPHADYSNEPEPNGHIADMGAYGNTKEATKSIPNSPEILIKNARLFFGATAKNDSVVKNIVITNPGDGKLIIEKLEFSTGNFGILKPAADINPHDTLSLLVYFNPRENKDVYYDTLRIYCNDLNESPSIVYLEGRAGTYVSGNVSGIWTAGNSPYIIDDAAIVPAGSTLTIEPGVTIKFKSSTEYQKGAILKVYGTLIAIGTPKDSIIFTRLGNEGCWNTIFLQNTEDRCRFEYCSFSYGSGTQVSIFTSPAALYCYNSMPKVKNCIFQNNSSGIYIVQASSSKILEISGCTFRENSGYAICNQAPNTIIRNNLIHLNLYGIMTTTATRIENNTIVRNDIGLSSSGQKRPSVKNCIIRYNTTADIEDRYTSDKSDLIKVSFSNISQAWPGYGNISLPPLFVNENIGDYHLLPSSPCIDGGDPKDNYSLEPVPNGSVIDMGAYGNTNEATTSSDPSQPDVPEILISTCVADFGIVKTDTENKFHGAIKNIGKAPLNISSINASGSFSVNAQPQIISPGDSIDIEIVFRNTNEGSFSDTIWVVNNDYTESKSFIVAMARSTSGLYGNISGTFTKEHGPYIIASNLTVPAGQTLTLNPGTRLEFQKNASMLVYGTLNCAGTKEDSIVITSNKHGEYWGGIYIGQSSRNSIIRYTLIENGMSFDEDINNFYETASNMIACENTTIEFTHNTLYPAFTGGIFFDRGNSVVTDNKVIGGYFAGIRSSYANINILRNFISSNRDNGIIIDYGKTPSISNNILVKNGNGVTCNNTDAKIINNTILNSTNSGIIISGSSALPVIKNNIIWGNDLPFSLYLGAERADIDISYNDIEGGYTGTGNFNSMPGFTNSSGNEYLLDKSSPCINKGDPSEEYNDSDGSRNDIGATGGKTGYYTTNVTDPEMQNSRPMNYSLFQNYPNPFNPITIINYSLPEDQKVKLKVYDMLGKEVITLVNEFKNAGSHTVRFDASSLPSGVYIYMLQAGKFRDAKKLLLLK